MTALQQQTLERLILVARAAHALADNTEEDEEACHCDPADFAELSTALDALDQLPDPPGETATGPRKAEYVFNTITPLRKQKP